ncbi:MAG: histidinol dehydrogenase [Planctomycetota bacterium]
MPLLKTVQPQDVTASRTDPLDETTIEQARAIMNDVRGRGEAAVREHAERLGDIQPGGTLTIDIPELNAALERLEPTQRAHLQTAADDIRAFAEGQRRALHDFEMPVPGAPGSRMGHELAPVERAGCYAPGGRYPLPSSVLMTAVTARAAGVERVWLASPRPTDVTLAAAAIAGVGGLLAIGGAQAIAAMVYGCGPIEPVDAVVGPGNRWVTAAKQLVAGRVAIDMLAGPSEVLVIADETADAATLAADLLAQAEHDDDAACYLVTTSHELIERVNAELEAQLNDLPTADTARNALNNSFAVACDSIDDAIAVSDQLAPEHLEIQTRDARGVASRCKHYGAVFIGEGAAEAVGDYGIGPNHTLPTGGTARSSAGLSVMTFLRMRTFLDIPEPAERSVYERTAALARMEGLEAHARSAERRLK